MYVCVIRVNTVIQCNRADGWLRGEMGWIWVYFDPDAQSLYARARTMIVHNIVFYQKHVQGEVFRAPKCAILGPKDGAWGW